MNIRAAGQDVHNDATKNLSTIEIPTDMLTKGDITQEIYWDFINVTSDNPIKDLSIKIILTTKNKDALRLKNYLVDFIPGAATIYFSVDSHIFDDEEFALDFPVEFWNQQFISGLPPHELKLKKGSIKRQLCNLSGDQIPT